MRLNSQVRYGVRALCDLVYNSAGSPVQIREICDRQAISQRYLEQIFKKLRAAGILRSVRGPAGGYFLARKADDIYVGEVIRALEGGDIQLAACLGEARSGRKRCDRLGRCALSNVWGEASGKLMEYFNTVSIAHVCSEARHKGFEI